MWSYYNFPEVHMYNRAAYKRRRSGIIKKARIPDTEEFEAFRDIREKW